MYQEERLLAIMEHLQKHRRISVQDICDRFGVSRDTARRDVIRLEEQGAVIRTRGGAILPSLTKQVDSYAERMNREPAGKRAIGRHAASLIKDGDYLIMDASTTVQYAAEYLSARHNVVVTNSIDIAHILANKPDVAVTLLGGQLNSRHRHVTGPRTIEMLADYQVDKLFLGACGITPDGLSNPYEEDSYVKREMIRRADQVIVLADHTKFGVKLFHRVSGLEEIDVIITDRPPDEAIAARLREVQIDVVVVTGGES